jgi:regulation of enolase protein 1 (concanavalin A-like superfamily)
VLSDDISILIHLTSNHWVDLSHEKGKGSENVSTGDVVISPGSSYWQSYWENVVNLKP